MKTLEKVIAFGKFIQNFGLLKTFLIQYKFKYKKKDTVSISFNDIAFPLTLRKGPVISQLFIRFF